MPDDSHVNHIGKLIVSRASSSSYAYQNRFDDPVCTNYFLDTVNAS